MKIIFIRGLPGTGKTTIANLLKTELSVKVICVDNFKLEAVSNGANVKDSRKIAYKKTLEVLELYIKQDPQYIIVEEIIYNSLFFDQLQTFVKNSNSDAYWFRIERPLEELLKIESGRNRKVKNTRENFMELNEGMDNIKIKKEIFIRNDDIDQTIKEITKYMG
ncbi:AAA family ATPase [bacterium]|nr:MAG: AAA family ATPase [bacterium]